MKESEAQAVRAMLVDRASRLICFLMCEGIGGGMVYSKRVDGYDANLVSVGIDAMGFRSELTVVNSDGEADVSEKGDKFFKSVFATLGEELTQLFRDEYENK